MLRVAVSLFVLACCPAQAATPGETVRASVMLGDRQMPLPAGEWMIAGTGTQGTTHVAEAPFGVIRTIVLVQRKGDRITAVAEFNTNAIALTEGWNSSSACDAAPAEMRLVRYRSRLDGACTYVAESHMTGGPPAWDQAQEFIAARHLQLPDTMLTTAFMVSDRQDFVDARLHFDPAGLPANGAAQRVLLTWAAQFTPEIEKGMANQLSGSPLDGPLRASLLSDSPDLDRRLLELERLQRAGSISTTDVRAQERIAQAEYPRSAEAMQEPGDSWYDRLSIPVINFITAYSVTQNPPLALAITVTEQVAHSVVHAANQAAWGGSADEALQQMQPAVVHIGDRDRRTGATS